MAALLCWPALTCVDIVERMLVQMNCTRTLQFKSPSDPKEAVLADEANERGADRANEN